MDVIFAKAAPAPSHHYSRLLKRNKASEQPSSDEFFAVKPPSSPHLYTPRGIIKGHRRTNSEVPPESPNGGKVRNSLLSKTTEKSHFELSEELMTSLHQRLEDIVQDLDSAQRQDLTILIEKLKSETQAAKTEASFLKQETEEMRRALRDSEIRREEIEVKCVRLQTQVAMLTQENQELEGRLSEDFHIDRELRDSISLSFDKDFPCDSAPSLQRELREKSLENEKLQKLLNDALRELKSTKSRLKAVSDRDRKENGAKTGTEVEMEAKETGNRCKKCGGEAGATHVCGRNTRERVEAVGFSNDLGDSNCFLNSALQSLNFEVDCPKTEDHFCVVCGLKAVNEEYGMLQHCGGGTIDITRYRIALAELFVSKDKFQLEKTADAMEALSAILQSLHAKASGDETLGLDENFTNRYCNAACPSHQAFSLELLEQLECKCRATSEPLPWDFSSFQFQVYVSDLIDEVSPLLALSTKPRSCISSIKGRLGETIKRVNVTYMQRKRTVQECPDNCRFKKSIKTMQLMSAAEGFILNLVWSEKNPKATEILSVIALLPTQMFLSSLFSQEAAAATGDTYTLKGFIAYGFVHYIAYFKTEDGWRKYDDAMVRTVSSYGKVMLNLVESRFHPVGVFYEKSKPDSLLVPDAVTDPEWDILELKASSITSEEIKDDEDWSCPLCSKTNLSGRMVCDTCFGLRPGLVGWACITCSSVNDDESDTCGTCGHYRKYVCRRCMKPGFSRTCRSCELLYEKTDSGKVCSKCKVKPAILEGVCSSCYDDISASKTLTMKSKKQSDILSQSLEMTTCPVCKSKMASDSGCPNCKKELVETRLSQSVIPGKEACTQCGKLKVNCMCVSSPVPAARAVVSFCTTCNRRRENCGCPQTKAVRECEVCHINELYCSCRNPPSHSTKLRTANAVCLKCNHRRENCVCPQTKAVRECERCHLSEANCTCRGSVSHSVKSEVDICARCRNPKRTCTCKGVSTVSKTPATKGEKVCIECRGFLTASKYCAKCFNSHSIVEAKCHRCLSQFRGWVCKKCKDKLQAASASRR